MTARHLRIAIVHPGVQHSPALAKGLAATGAVVRVFSRLQFAADDAPSVIVRRYPARVVPSGVPVERVASAGEAAAVVAYRTLPLPLWHRLNFRMHRRFQHRVLAPVIRFQPDVVIGFDAGCAHLFNALRRSCPEVRLVLEGSASPVEPRLGLLMSAAQRFPEWSHTMTESFDPDFLLGIRTEGELADLIVVGSSYAGDRYHDLGVPKLRISVNPYGVAFAPHLDSTGDARRGVVFVGTPSLGKGLPDLLEAWAGVSDGEVLHVVGGRPSAAQLARFDTSMVLFHGRLPRPKVAELMRSVRATVLPTYGEGLSLVLCEALRQGCGVVTTVNSGIQSITDLHPETEPSVEIVPAGDPVALAAGLRRARHLQVGEGHLLPEFDWDQRAMRTMESLASL